MIEYRFSLELTKNGIQKSIHAKVGEINGRKLIITLIESGELFKIDEGLSARMFFDDNTFSDDVPIVDGKICFEIPSGLVGNSGVRICELKLYRSNGTKTIYSPMFEIVVEKSLGNDANSEALRPKIQYQELIASMDIRESDMQDNDMIVVFDSVNEVVMRMTWSEAKTELGYHAHSNIETLNKLGSSDGKLTYNGNAVVSDNFLTMTVQSIYGVDIAGSMGSISLVDFNSNSNIYQNIKEIKTIRIKYDNEWYDIHSLMKMDGCSYTVTFGVYYNGQIGGYIIATMSATLDYVFNTIMLYLYNGGITDIEIDYYPIEEG